MSTIAEARAAAKARKEREEKEYQDKLDALKPALREIKPDKDDKKLKLRDVIRNRGTTIDDAVEARRRRQSTDSANA